MDRDVTGFILEVGVQGNPGCLEEWKAQGILGDRRGQESQ